MPQWAGSCWYYLRYIDPKNPKAFCDKELEKAWMPVDCYVGGSEHAVLHLLYARFWHKVLFDLGLVSTEEPFQKLRHQGMRIMQMPLALFGAAGATAALAQFAGADDKKAGGIFSRAVLAAGFLLIPATVGLLVLAPQIVQVLFVHGSFSPDQGTLTAGALRFYALALAAHALNKITVMFYGADNPYGRRVEAAGVSSITIDDVKKFYAENYRPQGTIIAVTGDFQLDDMAVAICSIFWSRIRLRTAEVAISTSAASVRPVFTAEISCWATTACKTKDS